MANITKRGNAYTITVSLGYDSTGTQIYYRLAQQAENFKRS